MKIAAYQAPLHATGSPEIVRLIREQIEWCESNSIDILCCPEGALGGLADYSARPGGIAIDVARGELDATLAPLASDRVTTILGFTEIDAAGRLFNSAAVFHHGATTGVYRKLHPAINRSVYHAGHEMPVFTVVGLTFGILICRDSAFADAARTMVANGATALFVPSNNGLPPGKAGAELVDETRRADMAMARRNGVYVIRADVAGHSGALVSHGSSAIVGPDGTILQSARQFRPGLIVVDVDTAARGARPEPPQASRPRGSTAAAPAA